LCPPFLSPKPQVFGGKIERWPPNVGEIRIPLPRGGKSWVVKPNRAVTLLNIFRANLFPTLGVGKREPFPMAGNGPSGTPLVGNPLVNLPWPKPLPGVCFPLAPGNPPVAPKKGDPGHPHGVRNSPQAPTGAPTTKGPPAASPKAPRKP